MQNNSFPFHCGNGFESLLQRNPCVDVAPAEDVIPPQQHGREIVLAAPQGYNTADTALALAPTPPEDTVEPTLHYSKIQQPRRVERSHAYWYQLCAAYVTECERRAPETFSQKAFLSAQLDITDTCSHRQSFSRKLKLFKAGKLKPNDTNGKRCREGVYDDVGLRVVEYIRLRQKLGQMEHEYEGDQKRLTWRELQAKANLFASQLGRSAERFRASPGWLNSQLKKHGISSLKEVCPSSDSNQNDADIVVPINDRFSPDKGDMADVDSDPASALLTNDTNSHKRQCTTNTNSSRRLPQGTSTVSTWEMALESVSGLEQWAMSQGMPLDDLELLDQFRKRLRERHYQTMAKNGAI